ncbi:HTH domain protein [Posidoniimonas polymericola]|uniref:HTH domain protein n=1 Tax=Posidoniimonas polymericola TaxID=2528002 RepID=A0A5C5YU30_9BACT|nr:WYL domain-containing protein [Posidoniimonas polymericola]TWT78522.1 HTH domain protein [Posidoniimonas polymericola]
MNVKRITRLLRLLQTLQSGSGRDATRLADSCGVCRRTLFRDLQTLKSAGVPVEYDREDGRYRVAGAYFLPPTNFTAEEAFALICLAEQSANAEMPAFLEPAGVAARKLLAAMPEELREQFRSLTGSVHLRPTARNPLAEKQSVYQLLVDAQAARRVVEIDYGSLTEWETIHTKLRPYELLFDRRSWYVIGRSSLHNEVRTFNVSRIHNAEATAECFRRPQGFSLARYLRNAWRLIPEPGPDSEVHVHFQSVVAHNVSEVRWHATQRCAWRDDGTLDFRATVSGLSEVSWWVLGYGDQAEVIAPVELRRLVARRAANMMRIYDRA